MESAALLGCDEEAFVMSENPGQRPGDSWGRPSCERSGQALGRWVVCRVLPVSLIGEFPEFQSVASWRQLRNNL